MFDPLAIMMLLAATETFAWRRQDMENAVETAKTLPSSLPVEENKEESEPEIEAESPPAQPEVHHERDGESEEVGTEDNQDGEPIGNNPEHNKEDASKPPIERTLHVEHIVLPPHDEPEYVPNPAVEEEMTYEEARAQFIEDNIAPVFETVEEAPVEDAEDIEEDIFEWKDEDEDDPNKRAKRIWKRLNPDNTLKHQEQLLSDGVIDELPWAQYIDAPEEKLESFAQSTFGNTFPTHPIKGDTYVKTDVFPSTLHKFNGEVWIAVDKDTSTSYVYNEMYIQHIIEKLGSGEYDPELLNDAERLAIEEQLKKGDL